MPLNYLLAAKQAESIQVLEDNISNVPELIDNCVTQNIRVIMASLLEQSRSVFCLISNTALLQKTNYIIITLPLTACLAGFNISVEMEDVFLHVR